MRAANQDSHNINMLPEDERDALLLSVWAEVQVGSAPARLIQKAQPRTILIQKAQPSTIF